METVHRSLLLYLPLFGYAAYSIMTGFENELFVPLFLAGWIVLLVYQVILAAIYERPKHLVLSTVSMILTPLALIMHSFLSGSDFSIAFIETTAIGMMSIVLALPVAF